MIRYWKTHPDSAELFQINKDNLNYNGWDGKIRAQC